MIKYFCDVCKKELSSRNYVSDRYKPIFAGVRCEVMVGVGETMNDGHICLACLLKVLNKGEIT